MVPTNKGQDLFNVNGLVAVITGGGSGLGLYAARALDANGAKAIYIIGRREQTLKDAAATATNKTIIPLVGDVTSKEDVQRITSQVRAEQGYINLLFANAGVSGPAHSKIIKGDNPPTIEEFATHMLESDLQDFTKTLHINTSGVFYTAISFLTLLEAGNKQRNVPQDSHIIVTSSVAGFSRYLASSFAYSTSKAAVTHLVKMLGTTFSQQGFHIRVNLVAPGLYPSEMTQGSTSRLESRGDAGAYEGAFVMEKKDSPAERTGSEEDFAGTVLFFGESCGGVFEWGDAFDGWGKVGSVACYVLISPRFCRSWLRLVE